MEIQPLPTGTKVILATVFILGTMWFASRNWKTSYERSMDDTEDTASAKPVTKEAERIDSLAYFGSNWKYEEDVDRMTSRKRFYAYTTSTNQVDFDFPYNGGTSFKLMLLKLPKSTEVGIRCDKCQFLHRSGKDNFIKAKFDDGSPANYQFVEASDGSTDIIFLLYPSRFITNLRKSKRLMIGADFYREGGRYIDFNVGNLAWNH